MKAAPVLARIGCFDGFGLSSVHLVAEPAGSCAAVGDRAVIRAAIRDGCPRVPGVYGIVSPQSRLIYVGYSHQLQRRVLSYFTGKRRGQKEHRIARHAATLHWEAVGHEFSAQLRELELIQRFAPDFNIKGRRRSGDPAYVILTDGEAPQFKFSTRVPANARQSWGPLPNAPALREAADRLNLLFRLRDCPSHVTMQFAEQGRIFKTPLQPQCLRGEIGTCLAPCAAACTRRSYFASLRRAVAWLDGQDAGVLRDLEHEMQTASAQMQFERAAKLRDALDCISRLRQSLEQLRRPPEPREGIYEVAAGDQALWYIFQEGLLHGVHARPESRDAARATLETLRRAQAGRLEPLGSLTRDSRRLVRAWFRQHPEELTKVQPFAAASETCKQLLKPTRRRA